MLTRRLGPSYSTHSSIHHPPEDSESPLGRRLPWRIGRTGPVEAEIDGRVVNRKRSGVGCPC